jgi:hypothetical protein
MRNRRLLLGVRIGLFGALPFSQRDMLPWC